MARIDLILLHPPALYDFRKYAGVHGPISDVIPSTPIFEMYPVGFTSISEYLERHGLKVRIINVAMKMLKDKKFNVERLIEKNNPMAFGIDLHWMPHVQGTLALAEIIKKYHPDTPVILGGLSATYFHQDILTQYPFIDFVMRGDSTEKPLLQLLQALKSKEAFQNIPNLTYRDEKGGIRVNPLSHVPETLDEVTIDYRHIMKKVVRYFDPTGYQPFINWYSYPMTAVFTCRGCLHTCNTCGASAHALRKMANRTKPAFRDPRLVARDILNASEHLNAPIMIIGDIFQPGEEYASIFLSELRKKRISNHIVFEFFIPPSRARLERIAESVLNFNIEISPESHDEEVRKAFGRPYRNDALEKMLADAVALDVKRIDLFFMTGLPKQTYASVMDTVAYCRSLLERFRPYNKLFPFISPLAPFVDPGSAVFEAPEKYGYRLFHRTIEEHRQALLAPSWKYVLNYETEWMSRDEIVDSTYEAGKRLNRLKAELGLIDSKTAESVESRLEQAVRMMKEIDRIIALPEAEERKAAMDSFSSRFLSSRDSHASTLCEKKELEWPTHFIRMNFIKILKTLLSRRKPNVSKHSTTTPS